MIESVRWDSNSKFDLHGHGYAEFKRVYVPHEKVVLRRVLPFGVQHKM